MMFTRNYTNMMMFQTLHRRQNPTQYKFYGMKNQFVFQTDSCIARCLLINIFIYLLYLLMFIFNYFLFVLASHVQQNTMYCLLMHCFCVVALFTLQNIIQWEHFHFLHQTFTKRMYLLRSQKDKMTCKLQCNYAHVF